MSTASMRHLSEPQAEAYVQNRLSPSQRAVVEAHLTTCEPCRRLVRGDTPTTATVGEPLTGSVFDDIRSFHKALGETPSGLEESKRYGDFQKLGEGGMGAVYQAKQISLNRIVALKVMRPEFVADPKAVKRFREEALAAAQLKHPNIVVVHDAEEENDTHFIVMEFVEGLDLHRLVKKKGPLDVHIACQLAQQAAAGLQEAFEQKVVHRDIKPHNLMVSKKGRVTVLDFGLARLARETGQAGSSSGMVLGTPAYMSPEQARAVKDLDIRADIYSLGATLYYLLTGQPPFTKTDILDLLTALAIEEPPALEEFRADVPAGLAELVGRMMAKDRDDRPATPGEVARALTTYTAKRAAKPRPRPAPPPEPEPIFLEETEPPPTLTRPIPPRRPAPEQKEGGSGWIVAAIAACGLLLTVIVFVAIMMIGPTPPRDKEAKKKFEESPKMLKIEDYKERVAKGEDQQKKEPPAKEEKVVIVPKVVIPAKKEPEPKKPATPSDFVNSIGATMKYLKGGRFQMGSPASEKLRSSDEMQHWVTVSDLYVGETEVTQKQFREVMKYNPSYFARNAKGRADEKYTDSSKPGGGAEKLGDITDTDDFPVENVSWVEAKEFCDRLNTMDTKKPGGWVYRLPREAEWEYSCQAGAVEYQIFHFGDILDNSKTRANFYGDAPYGSENKSGQLMRTCKVGSYPANQLGLRDMHGNVYEWCEDVYSSDYYKKSAEARDPAGPAPEAGSHRVLRGGGWGSFGERCRSAFRNGIDPAKRNRINGFRVALVPQDRK